MGFGEDRRCVLRKNNHSRGQWRQNSCAKRGEDGKWALCMHWTCVHVPHRHLKDCKAEWPNPEILNTPPLLEKTPALDNFHSKPNTTHLWWNCITATAATIFNLHLFNPALTSNQFWVGAQAPQPFIYSFVCQPTYTEWWIAQASEGPSLGSHWVCYPVCKRPVPSVFQVGSKLHHWIWHPQNDHFHAVEPRAVLSPCLRFRWVDSKQNHEVSILIALGCATLYRSSCSCVTVVSSMALICCSTFQQTWFVIFDGCPDPGLRAIVHSFLYLCDH